MPKTTIKNTDSTWFSASGETRQVMFRGDEAKSKN